MEGYYDVRQTSDNRYLDERARNASQDTGKKMKTGRVGMMGEMSRFSGNISKPTNRIKATVLIALT